MKTIGNLLWFLLTGFWSGLGWMLAGIAWCISIIGIPFGLQAFKLARLSFWPFGTVVKSDFAKHPIANVIWILFGGFGLAMGFFVAGLLWCITIIGIPFGKQCFKDAGLALTPFGADV